MERLTGLYYAIHNGIFPRLRHLDGLAPLALRLYLVPVFWMAGNSKLNGIDNAFIERLWRSVKYEKLYLNPPTDGINLYEMVDEYFNYYNFERRHEELKDEVPYDIYKRQLRAVA